MQALDDELIKFVLMPDKLYPSLHVDVNLVILAFYIRDIKCGLGHREKFYNLMDIIKKINPPVFEAVIPLIPQFGSWLDIFKLFASEEKLPDYVVTLILKQLKEDEANPDNKSISVLAKWLPREHGSPHDKIIAKQLARAMYPGDNNCQRTYRKRISTLNKRLNVVEIAMCDKQFESIDPAQVPNYALKRYSKAYLCKNNLTIDRINCSQNFTDYYALYKKQKQKSQDSPLLDCLVNQPNDNQWQQLVSPIVESGLHSKTLPLIDLSASMDGCRKEMSLALGLIIAECNGGKIMTFDSNIYTFKTSGLLNRMREITQINDLTVVNESSVVNEFTDLIIVTDIDYAHVINVKPFDYDAYAVVCWNLRAKTTEEQIQKKKSHIQLSGYSPTLLDLLVKKPKSQLTTEGLIQAHLESPRYDCVRDTVKNTELVY